MTEHCAGALATATLTVLIALVWSVTHNPFSLSQIGTVVLVAVCWMFFGLGVWAVRRAPIRIATGLILIGGIGLPLAAGFTPPHTSDDLYRYEWDGRVQSAGIDPYRYAPAAPELTQLRDPTLWPRHSAWCVTPGSTDHEAGQPLAPGCTLINRPTVHTIYPPVAEAYFWLVDAVSPHGYTWPAQLGAAITAIMVTILLVGALPRLGIDRRQAVVWAWCPTIALEAGNNGHVDVVGALLTTAGLIVIVGARSRARYVLGGAILGLAIATKLTPALVMPALARRRPFVVIGAAAAAIATVYLPHIVAVGAAVIGYIPGYLSEEGYASGTRFALLTLVVPTSAAAPIAVVILAAFAVGIARTSTPDQPWRGAVLMTGVALLVTTPTYSWYAILLVVLVALDGRTEWMAVAVAGYLALYAHDVHLDGALAQRIGYGAAVLLIIGVTYRRRRHSRAGLDSRMGDRVWCACSRQRGGSGCYMYGLSCRRISPRLSLPSCAPARR